MSDANRNVAEWLGQNGLGQYARTFAENHIDYSTLGDLTDGDLKDLGLSLGHRKKLLKAIQALAARHRIALNRIGRSIHITTGRKISEGLPNNVDDVIVMLEHIMRRLHPGEGAQGKGEVHERIAGAAWEFTRPLTGSSAATVVIFLPLAFLTGVTGAFFKALSGSPRNRVDGACT